MNIGLVDVDSHNFPNLPLMKISAFHKLNGDNVEFAKSFVNYDIAYMSKVFTESKEPNNISANTIIRGGSGYDLNNKLPYNIEHIHPDYNLYPQYDFALGKLTIGCPRKNHTFCITPKKDGCKAIKNADLSEFWNGQKKIILLDQNILACKDRIDLLRQLKESKSEVEFNGGMDARFINEEIINELRGIKVKDYHFAWDDPRENLENNFKIIKDSKLKDPSQIGVYVLTNYWSTIEEDLYRVYTLRSMGFMPFVMIFNKQMYVDNRGHWLPGVNKKFSEEQLIHFKINQHMQRWCGNRRLIKSSPDFNDYIPYKKWLSKGKLVPAQNQLEIDFGSMLY